LVVRKPDASAVANSTAIYRDYRKVTPQQCQQTRRLRSAVKLVGIELGVGRLDEGEISKLRATIEAERASAKDCIDDYDSVHNRLHIR
jgi:DNA-binding GntR family transcriptional regulator